MNALPAQVHASCMANEFEFATLKEVFSAGYQSRLYRDVLCIEHPDGVFFVFRYGIVVFWGMSQTLRQEVLGRLRTFAITPVAGSIDDRFTYEAGASRISIKNDHIMLDSDEIMNRLAVSHGIAQSIKLEQFEAQAQRTINETRHIPENIARTGSTRLSRRTIAKMRGNLFLSKSSIILQYDLLDVPEFFWEYPELEPYYMMAAGYLEVRKRLEILDKRLETIHELFEMMADEQKHKHSSMLEWIIIWLIAFEILVFLVHDVFALL